MPYDLSDDTGSNQQATSRPAGPAQAPSRPSDVLRGPQPGGGAPAGGPKPPEAPLPFPLGPRVLTPADSAVSTIFWLATLAALAGLAYLLWGVWSGALANPNFHSQYSVADQHRLLGNIATVDSAIKLATVVALAALLFLFYDLAPTGYALIGVAIFLNVGIPWLSQFFLGITHSTASQATRVAVNFISGMAGWLATPGFLLVALDIVRRSMTGFKEQKVRRSKLVFGREAVVHAKRRNQFLGYCWNMPYCKDALRNKCPIFIKHKGPCWRHKQGCMCESSIAVLATTAGNWKTAVATAMSDLDGKSNPPDFSKPVGGPARNPLLNFSDGSSKLTWQEKEQRCRECVIYNTHQEQKYKAMVWGIFGGTALIIAVLHGPILTGLGNMYKRGNVALGSFSFAGNGGGTALSNDISYPVAIFILSVLTLLIISKLLQLVEYCCFVLKI